MRSRGGSNIPFEELVFKMPLVEDVSFVWLDDEQYLRA